MCDYIDADKETDEGDALMYACISSGILVLNFSKQERRIYVAFAELYDSSVDKIQKYNTILLHWKRRKVWTARSLENL